MEKHIMRVAMVGPFPLHLRGFGGGVESYASNLIEGLMTFEDMEIHVVTCSRVLRRPVHLERDGVTYHYLPAQARLNTLSLYLLDRRKVHGVLREIDPDIVHAQDSLKYGYICLKTGYPLVMTIHGILREEAKHLATTVGRLRATITGLLVQRHCVKNARYIIHQTRYAEQYFGHLITGRTHDIANPVAEKFFDVNSVEEEGRLLYVGWVIRRKRPLDLVQALGEVRNRFPNVSLRIVGGTPDQEYLRSIREWMTTHDLEGNVKFLGSLTQDELAEEYKRCVLLALPSGQETSPIVIGDIMAVGKPVVATRVGAVPYLVDDGQTGFVVDVGDIDALANRILTILTDDELRSRMGKRAKEKANLNFRSRVVAAKVRQVYRKAIEAANLGE